MKFCPKRTYEYIGLNGITTSLNYVTKNDVLTYHGKQFTDQWEIFVQNKPTILIDGQKGYYYADYKHFAIATDMYVNCA